MFAGSWLAWPWFIFNGWAVGSPTFGREVAWALAGFAGRALLFVGMAQAAVSGLLSPRALPYAALALTLWTLGVSYFLYAVQGRTLQLYEHYGGALRNGLAVVLAGYFLRNSFLHASSSALLVLLFS